MKKLLFFFLFFPSICFGLDVTITITEPATTARTNEVISFGVPIDQASNITSVASLGLTESDGSTPIPAQFTVLSRWGGARDGANAIRWVLVDFQDSISSGATNTYHLKDNDTGNATGTNLDVKDGYDGDSVDSDYVTVDTGEARFIFEKARFAFHEVLIDSDGDESIDDQIAGAGSGNGLILTDTGATAYAAVYESGDSSQDFVVEKDGPLHSVLMWRGVFKTGASYFETSLDYGDDAGNLTFSQIAYYPNTFVYWCARLHFYNDKDYIRMEIALENNGADPLVYAATNPVYTRTSDQPINFDSLEFKIVPTSFSSPNITTDEVTQTALNTEYKVIQYWEEEETPSGRILEDDIDDGIAFSVTNNSVEIDSGLGATGQSLGWFEYDEGNKTISILTKDFWQNFPKTYTATTTTLDIGIWPGEYYYPWTDAQKSNGYYIMRGGTHKIHEFIVSFSATDGQLDALGAHLESPLMGVPDNIHTSNAGGIVASDSVTDAGVQDEIDRYETMQLLPVDSGESVDGRTWDYYRQIPTGQNSENYGWEAWGDIPWDGPYAANPSSVFYDMNAWNLMNFYRTGNYNCFSEGYVESMHRIVDQVFSRWDLSDISGEDKVIGMVRYENDNHGDSTVNSAIPYRKNSHIWAGGFAWAYWVTGSEWHYEAMDNILTGMHEYCDYWNLDASRCQTPENEAEHRFAAWPGMCLIWGYRVMGNSVTLQWIQDMMDNYFIFRESLTGCNMSGYHGDEVGSALCGTLPDDCPTDHREATTQRDYYINFFINAHWETQDEDIKDYILRIAAHDWDYMLFPSEDISPTEYKPISQFDNASWWYDNRWVGVKLESTIGLIFHTDLHAYAYYITGNSTHLDHAKAIFSDYSNYPSAGGTYPWDRDPSSLSQLKIGFGTFSGSEAKVHAWSLMGGKVFLYVLENGPVAGGTGSSFGSGTSPSFTSGTGVTFGN